tara:strand:- start:390 stop:782 length:393 start_codon:yes stop_codon:yes gene_type:complete
MAGKHLDGTGKGEFLYDFNNDILMLKIKDRDYKISAEFQNFVADVDTEGFVTGIRVFDASKVFGVDKYTLKNIVKWRFETFVENGMITIRLSFVGQVRNKEVPVENFTQQLTSSLNGHNLIDSSVECAVA